MKSIILSILFFTFIFTSSYSNIVDELEKLSELQKQGQLTEEQFEKAKDILLKIEKKAKRDKEKKILNKKEKNSHQTI